jgi:Tol biopolymer transport system component/DNA-binding winged helix-turn-helix (wHTH) protein
MEQQNKHFYEFGAYRLAPNERRLYRDSELVSLPPKEFDLLFLLVRNAGQPVSREDLLKALWPNTVVEEANLNVHVSALRKVLSERSTDKQFIETLPRLGYRFIAPVTTVETPEPAAPRSVAEDPASAAASAELQPAQKTRPALYRQGQDWRHRPALWFGLLALLAITLTGSLAGLYFYFFRNAAQDAAAAPVPETLPLTTYPGREFQPAFSPDGNQIAFVWRKENESDVDIYVRLVEGGNTVQLTNQPGDEVSPTWAPHGRALAFYRSTERGDGIFVVPALGGAERKVTDVWANRFGFGPHTWLHWSPQGKWLVVSDKTTSPEPFSLYLLSPETGERRRLTTPPTSVVGDCSPAFSPDGTQLAFIRVLSALVGEVFLMNAEGGEPRQLTFSGAGTSSLAWLPNGRELIYSSRYGGKNSLFRIPVAGGAAQALPFGGNDAQYPAFSAQGARLAWARSTDNTDIFRVALNGAGKATGQPTNLIASTAIETSPRYAPDGKRIVFVSNRSGSEELWVCGSAGENPIRLTSFRGPLPGSPTWSPDGRHIVFDCRPAGNADIFVVNSEGGQPRRLTTDAAEDIVPSWSKDGRWIYFTSQRSGSLQVWKIPADGGPALQVTQQGGFDPVEAPDGQWLYYTRDRGSAAIWRLPVAGGPESFVFDFNQRNYSRLWTVTEKGILFAVPLPPARTSLRLFSFADRAEHPLATFECILRNGVSGLSLAPDGSTLLFPVITQRGSDLMMVENFR